MPRVRAALFDERAVETAVLRRVNMNSTSGITKYSHVMEFLQTNVQMILELTNNGIHIKLSTVPIIGLRCLGLPFTISRNN